jgi:hypothetical protein
MVGGFPRSTVACERRVDSRWTHKMYWARRLLPVNDNHRPDMPNKTARSRSKECLLCLETYVLNVKNSGTPSRTKKEGSHLTFQ